MDTMEIRYRDGQIERALIPDPTKVSLTDCRGGDNAFVGIHIEDDRHALVAFMPAELARELLTKLQSLFAPTEEKEQGHAESP